jgi:hypothetical protein
VLDPSTGQPTFIGSPNQVLGETNRMLQANAARQDPNNTFDQSPMIAPIGKPSVQQAAALGAMPGGVNALSPALSKGGKLLALLSSGVQGALSGRAAEEGATVASGGRRSGGAGLGFEAGFNLPWQRAQMQQQLALGQAALQPVQTPFGPLPAEYATRTVLPWMLRTQSQEDIQQQKGANALDVQNLRNQGGMARQGLANQGRMDIAGLQTALAQHKGLKYLPDVDANGQSFYHVLNPYGQEIGRADVNVIPSLMTRTSKTTDFQTLDDGSIVALPKQTTSGPVLPSGQRPGASSNRSAGNGGGVRVITDSEGNPLQGKGSITSSTKTMVEAAPKVLDLVGRLRGQIQGLDQSGELGPGMSRWNDFWSGKVGTDNPKFRAMQTNAGLLSTLLMRMHVGARGGELIMQHFDQMIGAGHQSAANMLAALDEIQQYANDVQSEAPRHPNSGGNGSSRPTHVWTPQGLQPVGAK